MEIVKDSTGNLSFLYIEDKKILLSFIQKSHIRRMTLRFAADRKTLFVTAPNRIGMHLVENFLQQARSWIGKKLESIKQEEIIIKEGAFIRFFGENYQIKVRLGFINKAWIEKGFIFVQIRHERYLEVTLDSFFRQEALRFFTEKSRYYAQKIGKAPSAIKVRDLKSRWGSCTSKGSLSFSWRLAFAPLSVAEYVAIHEVVHLKFLNHSRFFWEKVNELCPTYKADRDWLKKEGAFLFCLKVEKYF